VRPNKAFELVGLATRYILLALRLAAVELHLRGATQLGSSIIVHLNCSSTMEKKKTTDATADMASVRLKDSVANSNNGDGEDPPQMKTTIYRQQRSGASLAKLGVNGLRFSYQSKTFTAYPVDSPTTAALVAKAPVPDDGEGMTLPKVEVIPRDSRHLFKVVVLLRDYSQTVNLSKLNLPDSAYQLVEGGRRRYFYFLFKNRWEADLFAVLYHRASLPASTSYESGNEASTSGADAEEEEDSDDFEASQDVLKIVRDHASKPTKKNIQPSIEEEHELSSSEND